MIVRKFRDHWDHDGENFLSEQGNKSNERLIVEKTDGAISHSKVLRAEGFHETFDQFLQKGL